MERDDAAERRGVERGAADERAVDVLLGISPSMLSGFTLPPYRMRCAAATPSPWLFATCLRMNAWTSCAWAGVATLPVPMAQTGS